jgi:hypothetical protein
MRNRQSQKSGEQLGTGEDRSSCILLAGCGTIVTGRSENTRTLTMVCTVRLLCV